MWFFQMALKTCEMCDRNGISIKIATFSKALQKITQRLEISPQDLHSLLRLGTLPANPGLQRVLFTLVCSPRFPI